jgi:hypothetical protein
MNRRTACGSYSRQLWGKDPAVVEQRGKHTQKEEAQGPLLFCRLLRACVRFIFFRSIADAIILVDAVTDTIFL